MLAILGVLVAPGSARGQGLGSGDIAGTVVDATGRPVAEALITLTSEDGAQRVMRTTLAGTFSATDLAAGVVDVLAEKVGYRPVRVLGVPVRPGSERSLTVTLPESGPAGGNARTVHYQSAGDWVLPGFWEWLSGGRLRGYPSADRWAGDQAADLSSVLAGGRAIEGLPVRLSSVFVDGIPLELPLGDPDARSLPFGLLGLSSAAGAQLLLNAGDVEWGDLSAGGISLLTRRGGDRAHVSALGTWSGAGLISSGPGSAGQPQGSELQGGFSAGGTVVPDTAYYFVALDARRLSVPYVQWPQGSSLAAVDQVAGPLGVDLAPYGVAHVRTAQSVSGTGAFDWRPSETSRLSLLGLVSVLPEVNAWRAASVRPATREALAAATLLTQLGGAWQSEARLWYENARLSRGAVTTFAPDSMLPLTQVSGSDLGFGVLAAGDRSLSAQVVGGRETLTAALGRNRVKLGAELVVPSYRWESGSAAARAFAFGTASDLASGQGLLEVTRNSSAEVPFSVPRYALFVQDTWQAGPSLRLLIGARADQALPSASGVVADTGWLKLSGVRAPRMPGSSWTLEPRAAFEWKPGEESSWSLRGGVGMYAGRVDPWLLGGVLASNGRTTVTRQLGAVGPWPGGVASGGDTRTTLETVASAFRPPVTTRATAALSHTMGPLDVDLGVIYRRTQFLPTWRDLNLLDVQTGQDQNGRPLYGTLAKEGGLLTEQPGSSRRFPGYGAVYALESSGVSRYLGGEVAVRARLGAGELFASYTHSRTQDNWLGAAYGQPAAALVPMAGTAGSSWAEGTSDFDVPDLAVVGGRLVGDTGPLHVVVSGAYRYRSGLPFTPGFGPGIDANGDGSALNDPAFVDPNVPGMQTLLGRWSCLKQDVGHLARRNGCRDPGAGSLDLELTAGLRSAGRFSAELVVQATGIAASGQGLYDHALLTVDPSAPLATNGAGQVSVPLVANPDFGTLRVRLTPPRLFRIGLRIRY